MGTGNPSCLPARRLDPCFVIMTDGYENASREYSRDVIFKSIQEHQEEQNWDFVYLGANQDAYQVGESIGILGGYTRSYNADPNGTRRIMQTTGESTASYMAASSAPESFFIDEPEESTSSSKK